MRGTGIQSQAWRRNEAGNNLRSWQLAIDDHAEAVNDAARLKVPIVELRTGEAVHSWHGKTVFGGLINAFIDHSVLVLPAQMLYLLHNGRMINILPELRDATTTIAVFGNMGSHWTLYIADNLIRQLYFQDTLGDRKGRITSPKAGTLRTWLTNNVSD